MSACNWFSGSPFGGGTFFKTEIGHLEVFASDGTLLAQYLTQPQESGKNELMTITRGAADIAWAVAYSEGDGSFGRIDDLSFSP